MHKVEKCLDGPLLPQKKLRGKAEPRLVKEKEKKKKKNTYACRQHNLIIYG
jgi:hypothetical protein